MYVVLIPFFLAANLSVDSSERWVYGPEFRYDGEVRTHLGKKMQEDYRFRIDYSLNCRIRDSRTMVCLVPHCSFEESTVNEASSFEEVKQELTSAPFEVNFDEKGVESVVIPHNNTMTLAILRLIASQFNIGTDLTQRTTTPEFRVTELGLFGECETLYEVEVKPNDESSEETYERSNYDLLLIPYANLKSDMKFEIKKRRDVASCSFNPRMENTVEDRYTPDLSMYNSKMTVTNRGMFESVTEILHKRKQKYGPRLITSIAHHLATMKLVDIARAEQPIEPISNPKTFSINPFDDED